MCRHHGGDEVVTGKREYLDVVPLAHAECVVDLAHWIPHGLVTLLFLVLASKHSRLLGQSLLLGAEMEPGGLELIGGLICDGD